MSFFAIFPTGSGGTSGSGDTESPVVPGGQVLTVDSNAANSSLVGIVTATDNVGVVDMDITNGNTNGAFYLAPDGRLYVNSQTAVAGEVAFTLDVYADDAAGNRGTGTVTVNVNQVSSSAAFRSQLSLATAGSPPHVLTQLGYAGSTDITRSQLDGILDAWVAGTGGTTRNVTSAGSWSSAIAAAQPGDLVRVTASFSTGSSLQARGNHYGIGGTTLSGSPAGGTGGLPIIVTCASGVAVSGTSLTSNAPVLDIVNNRHVWVVGFNVAGPSQFGIRCMNWGGTSSNPAYVAYCDISGIRDAALACQGWWQQITSSGGTPTGNAGDEWGFSEWFVLEENTIDDLNPTNVSGNPGEGIYLGRGASPGWVSYSKDAYVRGNSVSNFKGNGLEAKPGCRRVRFTDNLIVMGRGSNGAPIELAYQYSGVIDRPAHMNNIDGSGNGDVQIWCEGNRIYDYNISVTGVSRNQAIIVGMAGVRVANNMLWSWRNASGQFSTAVDYHGVLIQSEKPLSTFGDTSTQPTWVVNNNFQSRGIDNKGAQGGATISGVIVRNNITPVGYEDGTHVGVASGDYVGAVPAVGSLATADHNSLGPGAAFDIDSGAGVVGSGVSIADLGLFIDADILDRPLNSAAPTPGPFQP